MSNKRKRPVKVKTKIYDPNEVKHVDLEFNGIFHDWGNEAVETQFGDFGNFSVAIVEDENGQIHTVNPNHIQFLDR